MRPSCVRGACGEFGRFAPTCEGERTAAVEAILKRRDAGWRGMKGARDLRGVEKRRERDRRRCVGGIG